MNDKERIEELEKEVKTVTDIYMKILEENFSLKKLVEAYAFHFKKTTE